MPYLSVNNIELYYETSGKGEPLLLIHGLGSSTIDWEKQVVVLQNEFRVITMDMRGHGQSAKTKGAYSMVQFASDVAELIKKEKRPVHIAGISMGGMIAFQLAVDFPELVKSMVIINSSAEVLVKDRKTRNALRLRKLVPRIMGMKSMGKILGKRLFPHEGQEDLRQLIAERWAKNSVRDYVKSVNAIAGWSVFESLPGIKCPVLVIASEFDYSSIEEKQRYVEKLPNARLAVIPEARHAVSAEKPEVLNELMFNFLKNQ